MITFLEANVPFLNPFLGWESAWVCHNLRTEKEDIWVKYSEYKTDNCQTDNLHVENKASKVHFLANYEDFFSY